jgi:hypothetical protein
VNQREFVNGDVNGTDVVMKHTTTVVSFTLLALVGCSKQETATPAAKPVDAPAARVGAPTPAAAPATPPAGPTIPASFGGPLPDYIVYPGARQQLVLGGGAARVALVHASDPVEVVRLVVAGPAGVRQLRDNDVNIERMFGLFPAGAEVIAVEVLSDKYNGTEAVSAWRIGLEGGEVVVLQSVEAASARKLPRWIPASVRKGANAAAARSAKLEAEQEAARLHDEPLTEEEAEESAMTDAIETFESPSPAHAK